MTRTPHIRILMGTYNGATHLGAQLKSVAEQTHEDWSLWISDDGSKDDTRTIIEEFRTKHAHHNIQLLDGPSQGVAANYFHLLSQVAPDPAICVALADQDDVWLPEKLTRAVNAMEWQADYPVAYGAAQIFTDDDLTPQRSSKPCPAGTSFTNALVQNILSGSSLTLNAAALRLIQNTTPQTPIPFHDWWIYQIITGAGGTAIYDSTPALFYRQHAKNLLGGNRGLTAVRRRLQLLGSFEFRGWIDQNIVALQAARSSLTDENSATLDAFIQARQMSLTKRPTALRRAGIHRQTERSTNAFLSAAALGRI